MFNWLNITDRSILHQLVDFTSESDDVPASKASITVESMYSAWCVQVIAAAALLAYTCSGCSIDMKGQTARALGYQSATTRCRLRVERQARWAQHSSSDDIASRCTQAACRVCVQLQYRCKWDSLTLPATDSPWLNNAHLRNDKYMYGSASVILASTG